MDAKELRIVYMGTPEFAVIPLKRLVESGYNIVAVVTMPDKPAGRGLKLQGSAVKEYALEAGLKVLQPEKLKNHEFIEEFLSIEVDLAIVIAFRMLPEVIWSAPRLGTFNLHASLLPEYRGAAPINWALINGDKRSGVTTFMLNHEIDKGDILGQTIVDITDDDNAGTLHDKLMYAGECLVIDSIERVAKGDVIPIPQQHIGTLRPAPKIFKDDCRIDWSKNVHAVRNLVRGLSPYPAAWSVLKRCNGMADGDIIVKIYSVRIEMTEHNHPCGEIITDNKSYIKVACDGGYTVIDELQPAGKRRMKCDEYLRGFKQLADYSF